MNDTDSARTAAFEVLIDTFTGADQLAAQALFDEEEGMVLALACAPGTGGRLPEVLELARALAAEPNHATATAWSAYVAAILALKAGHNVEAASVIVEAESLLEQE